MRHFVGVLVAMLAVALLVSATTVYGATPNEYRPECENLYQSGKAVFDPIIANGKAVAAPMEQAFCGEQKHTK